MTTPRPLPERPSLESIRKEAKRLARDVDAGDLDAIARVRAQLPHAELPLSHRDVQLVLAREFGFAGWLDLRSAVLQRTGGGFEWAAVEALRAIHANDVARLKQLLVEHPALITWRDPENGDTLLQRTTSYALYAAGREELYNRPACAEVLIDAGAPIEPIEPRLYTAAMDTASSEMLELFKRKGILPRTLPVLAALGDSDAVRASFDASGALRDAARPDGASDLTTVTDAFMYACRFKHEAVASALIERLVALDLDLGDRIDHWRGRDAFVRYLCQTAALGTHGEAGQTPGIPWRTFVIHRLLQAMNDNDLPTFTGLLKSEPYVLSEAFIPTQMRLLEIAAYSHDRGAFIKQLLDLDPAILHLGKPPKSGAVTYAIEYGNAAALVPMLTRIWPVPDDLPHAAGMGDLERVMKWFDPTGKPALGSPNAHYPGSKGSATAQQTLDYALAWACMNRQFEIASFLLARGADINTRWSTHEPASILHECAWRNNIDAVKFLVDHGIDLTIRDHRFDGTAEGWARHTGNAELADFLAEAAKAKKVT